ncbi:hypothetical protein NIES4071_75400 [Calothrix sp. NIES-4071]|nr:hypothetical protein NIES4071_75400 [Calothrix sp. NIES-4071]BAZ61815.1 hypothetical protein NIES4105_75350 [Calothrix sp. NIES-4105]
MHLESDKISKLNPRSIKQVGYEPSQSDFKAKLVDSNGEEISISQSEYQLILEVLQAIKSDQIIHIVPPNSKLTTQQAADFLNVSHSYLIKLLEQGEIPYVSIGAQRRVQFDDLSKYREKRNQNRSQMLQKLIEMTEEAGLYEDE